MSQSYIFFSARVEPLNNEHRDWLMDLYQFAQAHSDGSADTLTNVERFRPYLELFDDPDYACAGIAVGRSAAIHDDEVGYVDIYVDDTDAARSGDAASLIYCTLKHFGLPHRVYFPYSYGDTSGECGGGVFGVTKHGIQWKDLSFIEDAMRAENEIQWKSEA